MHFVVIIDGVDELLPADGVDLPEVYETLCAVSSGLPKNVRVLIPSRPESDALLFKLISTQSTMV